MLVAAVVDESVSKNVFNYCCVIGSISTITVLFYS